MLNSWRADYPDPPSFGRQGFVHTIQPIGETGYDDLYSMNTQSGSQVSPLHQFQFSLDEKQLTTIDSGMVSVM